MKYVNHSTTGGSGGKRNFAHDLPHEIVSRLKADSPKARESGPYLQRLVCQSCGKPEAFTWLESPFTIVCQRANNCGAHTHVKALYPDLFENFERRYPATPADPKATATAFLRSRGIDTSKINFEQGIRHIDGKTFPSVSVRLPNGSTFHRLIDYKGAGGKARFDGPTKGAVFESELAKSASSDQEVFIVEGIIDAWSLAQDGYPAIATLSSSSVSADYYRERKDRRYVLAFDNDAAGHSAIAKHRKLFDELGIKYSVALAPPGKDWNDLLQAGGITEEVMRLCRWRGDLHTADSPPTYFAIWHGEKQKSPAIFTFRDWTFKGVAKKSTSEGGGMEYAVMRVADCSVKILYSIVDDSIEYRARIRHIVELKSAREGSNRVELTAEDLSSPQKFREQFAHNRQIFDGELGDLQLLSERLYNDRPAKVRQLSALGFDEKSGCFAFSKFLYDQHGKRHELNGSGYFDRFGIMPFRERACISALDKTDPKRFILDLYSAFSWRGVLALGFYVAAAFSHVIFRRFGFFPFLSLYGAPHSGKSTLTSILNRCFFVDWEGVTMTRANTQKGELRRISQKASLVTPLLESTGQDKSRFDFNTLLGAYNRNPLQVRAATTNGNETNDLPFAGCLSFVQNIEPFTDRAAKERIISVKFPEGGPGDDDGAFRRLISLPPESLAGIGDYILSRRSVFEERISDEIDGEAASLRELGVSVDRIAKNHAVALAGIGLLLELAGVTDADLPLNDFAEYVAGIAKVKCATAKSDLPLADHFLSMVDGLESMSGVHRKDGELFLSMPSVLSALREQYGDQNDKSRLFDELRRHERFREANAVHRLPVGRGRYWVFAIESDDSEVTK